MKAWTLSSVLGWCQLLVEGGVTPCLQQVLPLISDRGGKVLLIWAYFSSLAEFTQTCAVSHKFECWPAVL